MSQKVVIPAEKLYLHSPSRCLDPDSYEDPIMGAVFGAVPITRKMLDLMHREKVAALRYAARIMSATDEQVYTDTPPLEEQFGDLQEFTIGFWTALESVGNLETPDFEAEVELFTAKMLELGYSYRDLAWQQFRERIKDGGTREAVDRQEQERIALAGPEILKKRLLKKRAEVLALERKIRRAELKASVITERKRIAEQCAQMV